MCRRFLEVFVNRFFGFRVYGLVSRVGIFVYGLFWYGGAGWVFVCLFEFCFV